MVAVSMLAEFAHGAGAFGICDVKFGGARGGLMRLRGGASAAAQMAAIRAERAKNFEAEKQREDAAEAAEVEGFDGAGKAWCYAKGKVGPETVGTKKQEMAKGDARNFYFEEGATVLRNKKTGMVIELLDGSRGWFLFSSMEGGPVQQVSKEGNILGVSRWYVSGLIEDVKANPLKSSMVKAAGYRSGNWKVGREDVSVWQRLPFWPFLLASFSAIAPPLIETGVLVPPPYLPNRPPCPARHSQWSSLPPR